MVTKWGEIGTSGLEEMGGYIYEAYNSKLYWPTCYEDFNRIRRSDPEIGGIVRPAFVSMARQVELDWVLPDDANDAEKRAQEFGRQVLEDIDGGIGDFLETLISHVPFMGWGWWEILPGLRKEGWRPPAGDTWRSRFADGLVGIRRFAWRDHSSFSRWEFDDAGRVSGFWQTDPPNPRVLIPLDRSLHIVFGDPNNPEGLSPLEAVWRLERIKYGLELVQGIGFEHAAGHVKFKVDGTPDADDKATLQKGARAILSAQEGNFVIETDRITADVMDVPFSAASPILEAIRYYGLMKLQVFSMQWAAMATTADTGAFSAVQEGTAMGISAFNGMMAGFTKQLDDQVGSRLFELWNSSSFAGMERRPRLVAIPIEKTIPLDQLASFLGVISSVIDLTEDDLAAIRRKSGFLPEAIQGDDTDDDEPDELAPPDQDDDEPEFEGKGELVQKRPLVVGADEGPSSSLDSNDALITEADIDRAVRQFDNWAAKNRPDLKGILDAEIVPEEARE